MSSRRHKKATFTSDPAQLEFRSTTERSRRSLVVLLFLAIAPLVTSLLLYGHRSWTSQWSEIPVAFGLTAPSYPWIEGVNRSDATGSTEAQPLALDKLFVNQTDNDVSRGQHLHGLCLILRDYRETIGGDPAKLLWRSELSSDGHRLLAESWDFQRFDTRLQSVVNDAPHDLPLQADFIFGSSGSSWWRVAQPYNTTGASNISETPVTRDSRQDAPRDPSRDSADPDIWQVLADAVRVLQQNSAHAFPQIYAMWYQWGTVPTMHAGLAALPDPLPLDEWGNDAYAEAMEKLSRASVAEYLEKPLEDRAQHAWETLGLPPQMARYAARNSRSSSALTVGRQCALHLELLEKLVSHAIAEDDVQRAARWAELMEGVATVLEDSVRSPWLFNYVQKKRAGAGALAQLVHDHPDCPPDVASRMAAIVARSPTITPRPAIQPGATFAAFCLESIARSSLRFTVVTLTAAAIAALHLRVRRERARIGWAAQNELPGSSSRAVATRVPQRVALAAFALVAGVFVALESSNLVGQNLTSSLYALVLVVVLLGVVAGIGWLAIEQVVRDSDPQRQTLRRRIAWLIGLMLVLAAMRPIVGMGTTAARRFGWLRALESPSSGVTFSAPLRLFLGLLVATTACTYALLRWRRARREPQAAAAIHPLVTAGAAIWLGLWIALGPPGAFWHGGQLDPFNFGGESSALLREVDTLAFLFQGPSLGSGPYGRGCNALTFSVAARMIHVGLWVLVACLTLWLIVARRTEWAKTGTGTDNSQWSEQEVERKWLTGVTWSCLWLGLVAFAIHAWCTLGAGYYVSRVLAQVA